MGKWIRPKREGLIPWKPNRPVALPTGAHAKVLFSRGWSIGQLCAMWYDSAEMTNDQIQKIINETKGEPTHDNPNQSRRIPR